MHTSEDFVRLALAEFPELAQELEDEMFPAEVAILDLGLPVMDGFELARRIVSMRADLRPRLVALNGLRSRGGHRVDARGWV